jgi:hypothetical protein
MLGAKGSTKLLPAGKNAKSDVPYHSVADPVGSETVCSIRIQIWIMDRKKSFRIRADTDPK